MKKILSNVLAIICVFALFLGSAENPDGSCNLIWTLSCLAVSFSSGYAWAKLNPEEKEERHV